MDEGTILVFSAMWELGEAAMEDSPPRRRRGRRQLESAIKEHWGGPDDVAAEAAASMADYIEWNLSMARGLSKTPRSKKVEAELKADPHLSEDPMVYLGQYRDALEKWTGLDRATIDRETASMAAKLRPRAPDMEVASVGLDEVLGPSSTPRRYAGRMVN